MKDKMMSYTTLISKVHVAKSQLKITDEEYRGLLSRWNVKSSKEMNFNELKELLQAFEKLGWVPQSRRKERKFIRVDVPDRRPEGFATPLQLEKINLLWVKYSRAGDKVSLQRFVKRILGVDLLESIQEEQVHVVIKAIQSLNN